MIFSIFFYRSEMNLVPIRLGKKSTDIVQEEFSVVPPNFAFILTSLPFNPHSKEQPTSIHCSHVVKNVNMCLTILPLGCVQQNECSPKLPILYLYNTNFSER